MTYSRENPNAADNVSWRDVKKDPINIPIDHEAIELSREMNRQRKHKWRQRNNEIYCEGLHETHGFYISPEYLLTGIDENGNPLLKHWLDDGKG